MSDEATDEALVHLALAGGPEAFVAIVERFRRAVFSIALTRMSNRHDAEDVAQNVFLEGYERLGSLKDPARLGAWLRSITIHRCIDALRKRGDVAALDEINEPIHEPAHAESQAEEWDERKRSALLAIQRLNQTQRETVTLHYLSGHS